MLRHQSLECAAASLITLGWLVGGGGGGGGCIQLISATSNKKKSSVLDKICSLCKSMIKSELGFYLLAGRDEVHGQKMAKNGINSLPIP